MAMALVKIIFLLVKIAMDLVKIILLLVKIVMLMDIMVFVNSMEDRMLVGPGRMLSAMCLGHKLLGHMIVGPMVEKMVVLGLCLVLGRMLL